MIKVKLVCNNCGEEVAIEDNMSPDECKKLIKEGWLINGDMALCPMCVLDAELCELEAGVKVSNNAIEEE